MYAHRRNDPEFNKAWKAAEAIGLDALEDEVTRRGTEGWEEPVFYQGEVCGHIRKFSDTLLMCRLNGGRPEKYGRQRTELTGANGGPIVTTTLPDDPVEAARAYQAFIGGKG